MATYTLVVILRNHLSDDEFLVLRQQRPPKFDDQEYDSFVDSDLWDLPSTQLNRLAGSESGVLVEWSDICSGRVDLADFDLGPALDQVSEQLGFKMVIEEEQWKVWKYVEEPEFGPGLPVNTVFIVGKLVAGVDSLQESYKWMTIQSCLNWLVEVKPSSDRIGPLLVVGILNDSMHPAKSKVPPTMSYQEYPPSVILVPMRSRTQKPFKTTNLIVFAPEHASDDCRDSNFVARGDALIVDPGCKSECHEELMNIVSNLPKKLVVFVTHHHQDHVDGLSIVQKYNPDATLVAHENTMCRIGKGDWSLGYTTVSGNEDICIGGQPLRLIFAPGHTDGHMALLHVSTNSLIVGDHCVGQGSAILDINSGGNMSEYFQSTYNFLELSPHVLIPMHGRLNLWPKHMLCGYLKNRRSREASIVKAIKDGAETLFDIVSNVYAGVDRSLWIPAASNVRLHMDHLAEEDKLPKGFSLENYNSSIDAFYQQLGKL